MHIIIQQISNFCGLWLNVRENLSFCACRHLVWYSERNHLHWHHHQRKCVLGCMKRYNIAKYFQLKFIPCHVNQLNKCHNQGCHD